MREFSPRQTIVALTTIFLVAILGMVTVGTGRLLVFAGTDIVRESDDSYSDNYSANKESSKLVLGANDTRLNYQPQEEDDDWIDKTLTTKQQEIRSFNQELKSAIETEKKLQSQVSALVLYLSRQGSPVATEKYARQIITTSQKYGGDYRMIVAIMGVESGFCNANYMVYNCFGYLNGVQYSSYTDAFANLIPKIVRQYVIPFGTNFTAFADAYGIVNVEYHSERLARYYYSL